MVVHFVALPTLAVSIAQVGQHGLGLRKVRAGEFAAQRGRRHRHHHYDQVHD